MYLALNKTKDPQPNENSDFIKEAELPALFSNYSLNSSYIVILKLAKFQKRRFLFVRPVICCSR